MRRTLSTRKQIALCVGIVVALFIVITGSTFVAPIAGLTATGSQTAKKPADRAGVPVIVSLVENKRDTLNYETVGTGVASRSVMLRSEVEGTVETSKLVSGKRFSLGELLLTLESLDEQLALRLAETRLRQAEQDKDRLSDLLQRGITPETVYNEAVTTAELAKLEFERAQVALKNREIRAPFDGVSGLPAVEPGDRVSARDEIATFDDRTKLMVEFDLPETLLTRVDEGKVINATTPSVPDKVFQGIVHSIDSRIDPRKRSARVRVEIPNSEDELRPGASFTLKLDITGDVFPTVPELALQFERSGLYVWRIKDQTAEKIEVSLVRRQSGSVLVNGELSDGDRVVTEGTQRLTHGRSVEILGEQSVAE